MTIKKKLITMTVVVAIIGGAAVAVSAMMENQPELAQTQPEEKKWVVQTHQVSQGDFRPEQQLIGSVRSARNQSLRAEISSSITSVENHSGKTVMQGDPIIALRDFNQVNQLASANADLQQSNASINIAKNNYLLAQQTMTLEKKHLVIAQSDLADLKRLLKDNLVSPNQVALKQADVDSRELRLAQLATEITNHQPQLQQLEASRNKAEIAVVIAQEQLDNTLITAPFNGRLTRVNDQIGTTVNLGQELAFVYSVDDMEIVAQLPQQLASELSRNTVDINQISGWWMQDGERYSVALRSLSGSVEQGYAGQTGIFTLVEGGEHVTPGQSVSFVLEMQPVQKSFLVPELALFEGNTVYVKGNEGRLHSKSVKLIGRKVEDQPYYVIASSELAEQDELLITRLTSVTDGMLVVSPEQAEEERQKKLADEVDQTEEIEEPVTTTSTDAS